MHRIKKRKGTLFIMSVVVSTATILDLLATLVESPRHADEQDGEVAPMMETIRQTGQKFLTRARSRACARDPGPVHSASEEAE